MRKALIISVAVLGVLIVGLSITLAYILGRNDKPTPQATWVTPPTPTTQPVPTSTTSSPVPKPSISTKTKTVYIKPKPTMHRTRNCNATMECPWGTFSLTKYARPGPIHAYAAPNDSSTKLYPIYANETVTIYCFVYGQNLQGHPKWDVVEGGGFVWDRMIDTNGMSPPQCDYEEKS